MYKWNKFYWDLIAGVCTYTLLVWTTVMYLEIVVLTFYLQSRISYRENIFQYSFKYLKFNNFYRIKEIHVLC